MSQPHHRHVLGIELEVCYLSRRVTDWLSTLLVMLLWSNFVYFWIRVYRETVAADYKYSITHLLLLMSGYAVIVTLWIFHNVRIHHKKGSRKGVRAVVGRGSQDALRNQIAFITDPRTTQAMVIEVSQGQKTFRRRAEPVRDILSSAS
jgi:hypothetical protein